MNKRILSLLSVLACLLLASCSSTKKTATEPIETDDTTEISIDVMPQFQGGDHMKFRSWVTANVRYPDQLYQEYIDGFNPVLEGRVMAVFIVEKDGSIKEVEILSAPHRDLGIAVRQVLRRSPKWTPGYKDGEPARVRFTLPVDFKLPPEYKASLERQRLEKIANRNK